VTGSYDQVRYPGRPLVQTHPDRLATVAGLFGLTPAAPGECRVLELGCGDGGNLIPMALCLPRSEFTGIDLARDAIHQGCALANALALRNITLRQMDLMEAGPELGEFDYIVAHGVYSWVPRAVRDQLLHICCANLAPSGVAYVSYNTYPGFHLREMFRNIMLHHVRGFEDPIDRVQRAVEVIEALHKCGPEGGAAQAYYAEQLTHLAESEGWYLFHDDLATYNHALYFHEFAQEARRHGLQYLGEADFLEMQDDIYAEPIPEVLQRLAQGDVIRKEQYLDFIKGRRFRQTLLCHEAVVLERPARPKRIITMYLASGASPVSSAPDVRPGVFEEFRGPRGAALSTDDPQAKAALLRLREIWPLSMHFAALLAETGGSGLPLAQMLLRAYSGGLLEVHTLPSLFTVSVSERPAASPLAKWQAQEGAMVTTLRHTIGELDDVADRCLILLLDGTRDGAALIEGVRVFLRSRGMAGAEDVTAESLEARLERLAREALLVG
jgi:SAM-dependent methyltransferase